MSESKMDPPQGAAPAFTLYYLPLRARAEQIRFILRYANIPYKDVTVPADEWPSHKSAALADPLRGIAPCGQLPTIRFEATGETIAQSGAIVRYVSKLAGISPTDPIAAARADMIYEIAQDMNSINAILNFWPVNTETFVTNCATYFENFPHYAHILETLLMDSSKAFAPAEQQLCAYFGGERPHYGDFALLHVLDASLTVEPNCLQSCPQLTLWMQRMRSIPAIAAYFKERPTASHVGFCGSFIQTQVADYPPAAASHDSKASHS